jgi:hypothetical protein
LKTLRYGLVAFLMATLAVSVHAQQIYAGILGGLHFADAKLVFENNPTSNHSINAKTRFGVGGSFGLSLNEYVSVQLEPMFLQKGGIYVDAPAAEMDMKTSQLELQLLLKAGMGGQIHPYILAGPSISFVLDASAKADLAGRRFEGDLMQILKRTEYGVVFGAGISAPVGPGSALIECRYGLGLSNLNKGGRLDLKSGSIVLPMDTLPGDDLKMMGVQIMAGYQLPLGGE